MEKFIINNFRLFDNNFEFETPPITILTGKNNSGKSSFIKALLLFDDYISSSNQLFIDFTGNKLSKHKINSFDNAKNWDKGNSFSFTQNINGLIECSYVFVKHDKTKARLKRFQLNVLNSRLSIKFEYSKSTEGDYKIIYTKDIIEYATLIDKIKFLESSIELNEKKIQKTIADPTLEQKDGVKLTLDHTNFANNKRVKDIELKKKELSNKKILLNELFKKNENKKFEFVVNSEQSKRHDSRKSLIDLIASNILDDYASRIKTDIEVNKNQIKKNQSENKKINTLPDYYFPFFSLFFEINNINIHHLSPNRTKQERLYIKNHENTEIETEIAKFVKTSHVSNFLQTWLEMFKIGDDINIRDIEGIASMVLITEKNKTVNLVDLGFGAGQILTILLKIANTINEINSERKATSTISRFKNRGTNLIIIEEPESNLHPALQSYLAFLFIEVYKEYGIRFIIETHSEYFIRNLQLLIAENHYSFQKDDTVIYYMSNSSNENRINKISINMDGSLTDKFGEGFLDEATKKSLKLMEIKNKNRKI
jgi:predicted ATPase